MTLFDNYDCFMYNRAFAYLFNTYNNNNILISLLWYVENDIYI